MKREKSNILTLEQFKDRHYGKRGTKKRDELEAGYKNFRIGALIQESLRRSGFAKICNQ